MLLEEIVAVKREEVARAKARLPLERLIRRLPGRPTRDFRKAIHRPGRLSVIAEIKYASPSKGDFGRRTQVSKIARTYQRSGAAALSVLTDRRFFKGSPTYLEQARRVVRLPLLRKDFIIDEYQIYESRWLGADAILLIAGILSGPTLRRFLRVAHRLRLACLVEVHTRAELKRALAAGAEIIGINNRDLGTFTVDLRTTERLRRLIPRKKIIVAESGIQTRADVEYLKHVGVDAILVGETLMRARDMGHALAELIAA